MLTPTLPRSQWHRDLWLALDLRDFVLKGRHSLPECRSKAVKATARHLFWQSSKGVGHSKTVSSLHRVGGRKRRWQSFYSAPQLEGNYRDKDRDSDGNTPGFQRSPYQNEGERWHGGCSVYYLCQVHFLCQNQSNPAQKTRLQKNNMQMQREAQWLFRDGSLRCHAYQMFFRYCL